MQLTEQHAELIRMFLNAEIAENFDVKEIKQGKDRTDIHLEEYKENIPKDLSDSGDEIVLDGFCN
jgi:hypothetical protein